MTGTMHRLNHGIMVFTLVQESMASQVIQKQFTWLLTTEFLYSICANSCFRSKFDLTIFHGRVGIRVSHPTGGNMVARRYHVYHILSSTNTKPLLCRSCQSSYASFAKSAQQFQRINLASRQRTKTILRSQSRTWRHILMVYLPAGLGIDPDPSWR